MATKDPRNNTDPKPKGTKTEASETMSDLTLEIRLQAHLGRSLKAVYEPLMEESVPERLRKLLGELERREAMSSQSERSSKAPA
jgi:hypothetical protein